MSLFCLHFGLCSPGPHSGSPLLGNCLWAICILAHPFGETEYRDWLPLFYPQRIQYVTGCEEFGAHLPVMSWTVMVGVVVCIIVPFAPLPIVCELFLVLFIPHVPVVHIH